MTDSSSLNTFIFDARGIAKRLRHAAIFGAIESLADGERMRFVNDHDPLPLLYQIEQRYGSQVRIEYVERRPQQIVIDFVVALDAAQAANDAGEAAGCAGGSAAGGCGCSG
jgi:uncharacterized protein (DUF2249 family)